MKVIVHSPIGPMSRNLASHRAAQGVIYADMLRQTGLDVTVNMSLDCYYADMNEFDALYVYHGNDWNGSLNLFGGLREFQHVQNIIDFSTFKGPVYSLVIPSPDYVSLIESKMKSMVDKGVANEIDPRWYQVDYNNWKRIQAAPVVNPNTLYKSTMAAMGDSHAISMYRPGWLINSVPFKTLHGALSMGLESFLPVQDQEYTELEYYFGNIDIRHHLMRQENPEEATRELVQQYVSAAHEIGKKYNTQVKLYAPLPIENIRRAVPKTGHYKGTAYFGSWDERNHIRDVFIAEALKQTAGTSVSLYQWNNHMINSSGELDFKYMEQPKSVHLSREHYPHWQGKEYNKPLVQPTSILDFIDE